MKTSWTVYVLSVRRRANLGLLRLSESEATYVLVLLKKNVGSAAQPRPR